MEKERKRENEVNLGRIKVTLHKLKIIGNMFSFPKAFRT